MQNLTRSELNTDLLIIQLLYIVRFSSDFVTLKPDDD